MRVLVVGGGGREHALVWKIAQSPLVEKIFCAPGNAGMRSLAECVPIKSTDLDALLGFATREKIDLTVVGPEAPLIAGIVDRFECCGLPIFGPSADPARIEGSKAFAKEIMKAAGIPTAEYWTHDSLDAARTCVQTYFLMRGADAGIVIKADGIAAGKGVVVAPDERTALEALDRMMKDREFGAAGDRVVIEERLIGQEASIMAITDGDTILPLLPSQDHKRVGEGDTGPNTGGMGAYCPVPVVPQAMVDRTIEEIIRPAIHAIRDLGIPYRGVLYAGIIITESGPKCIEFNCRLGDPETQTILPMLDCDIVPILTAVSDCTLEHTEIRWKPGASICVVAASGGYPADYETGEVISGLETASALERTYVFHAGTRLDGQNIVTDGGRVLAVTGIGENLPAAALRAYTGIGAIHFKGIHYRRDIGARALP